MGGASDSTCHQERLLLQACVARTEFVPRSVDVSIVNRAAPAAIPCGPPSVPHSEQACVDSCSDTTPYTLPRAIAPCSNKRPLPAAASLDIDGGWHAKVSRYLRLLGLDTRPPQGFLGRRPAPRQPGEFEDEQCRNSRRSPEWRRRCRWSTSIPTRSPRPGS